ncbi:uncharacterized protein LOC124290003 [Haliotis rubra]|uniref:uncharacterized protein LOC124290003 n=1 Tax=Haliotis rubra TaxID=36100 RepID=UPI001EE5F26F|nr:uncharacterized protein LOC124290003 [Haliotis rubra]
MQELMYVTVIVSVCVFSGVSEGELLIDPPTDTYTVAEGTNVMLTCYIKDSEGMLNAKWNIEGLFVAKTAGNSSKCYVVYGPNNVYTGVTTTASCNQTSSWLMIENFTTVEAKNWSCSSGRQSVHILLVIKQDSSDLPTSPATTDVPRRLENASTGYQQPTMDVDDNLAMIYSLTAAGILVLVLVLVLVCVLKVRISRRDRGSKRGRMRSDSSSSLAEMAENPVYWTAGNVTASEARHAVPVANDRPDSVEVSDLYAKVQKSNGRGAEARPCPDNNTQSGGRVEEQSCDAINVGALYSKVQRSEAN